MVNSSEDLSPLKQNLFEIKHTENKENVNEKELLDENAKKLDENSDEIKNYFQGLPDT